MTKPLGDIPRGVEVLVKKAAVDAAFREVLLRERGGAAARIGLALEPAEEAMLAAIPARQLEQVIAGTRVPAPLRAAFMGYAAAAMLATLFQAEAAAADNDTTYVEENDSIANNWAKYGVVVGYLPDYIFEGAKSGIGVWLEGTDIKTVTEENGRFKLPKVPPSEYRIIFSKEGYPLFHLNGIEVEAASASIIMFTPPNSDPPAYINIKPISDPERFYAEPLLANTEGYIKGQVLDQNKQPVAGALVVIKGTNRFGTTDAEGQFELIKIPEGTHEIKVSRVGYGEIVNTVLISSDPTDLVVITLTAETVGRSTISGIRPDFVPKRQEPSALNTLMNKIFGKDDD